MEFNNWNGNALMRLVNRSGANLNERQFELKLANLRIQYRDALEGRIENDPAKIAYFEAYVLPALAKKVPITINGITKEKFVCLDPDCIDRKRFNPNLVNKQQLSLAPTNDRYDMKPSFVDKQKFYRHLTTMHDQQLPGGGSFIRPNDNSTMPGGFWCSVCGQHFCRLDHFSIHKSTVKHAYCSDAEPSCVPPAVMVTYE